MSAGNATKPTADRACTSSPTLVRCPDTSDLPQSTAPGQSATRPQPHDRSAHHHRPDPPIPAATLGTASALDLHGLCQSVRGYYIADQQAIPSDPPGITLAPNRAALMVRPACTGEPCRRRR
jgi:hypothetical protein